MHKSPTRCRRHQPYPCSQDLSRVQRFKRPRSSYTSFARSRTCQLRQLDAFEADRAKAVYQIIDDASRLCIAITTRGEGG